MYWLRGPSRAVPEKTGDVDGAGWVGEPSCSAASVCSDPAGRLTSCEDLLRDRTCPSGARTALSEVNRVEEGSRDGSSL